MMTLEPATVASDAAAPTSAEQRVIDVAVERIAATALSRGRDLLAVEEPLEIRLEYGAGRARTRCSITVTMRTPGSDVELAVGFLFADGLARRPEDVERAADGRFNIYSGAQRIRRGFGAL